MSTAVFKICSTCHHWSRCNQDFASGMNADTEEACRYYEEQVSFKMRTSNGWADPMQQIVAEKYFSLFKNWGSTYLCIAEPVFHINQHRIELLLTEDVKKAIYDLVTKEINEQQKV